MLRQFSGCVNNVAAGAQGERGTVDGLVAGEEAGAAESRESDITRAVSRRKLGNAE